MRPEDISRFFAVTPIWFWPLLWWNLRRLDRLMAARMAAGERGLARVLTNGRGRLRLEWIGRADAARAEQGPFTDFAHLWADHDLVARLAECRTGWAMAAKVLPRAASIMPPVADAPLEPG